jgi:serine/threonine protein kinase
MSLQEATKIPISADLGESESLGKGGHSSSTLLLHYEEELDSAGLEFLAPEVVSGASLSSATDMWAFGVILYVLLRYNTCFGPPEVVSGAIVSSATDMWAFGVILYVLLRYNTCFGPPEAVSGASLSSATDMWAFGAILYVLLRYSTCFWPPEAVSGASLSSATDMPFGSPSTSSSG